jgi:hypothetical protein
VTEPALSTAAPKTPLWEDFIDIFTSPRQVFARREGSGFGLPLLILTVLFAILIIGTKPLAQPAIDAEMARGVAHAIKAHPEVPAAQIQQGQAMGEKFGMYFLIISLPIMAMLTGLVLWVVGKIFDAKESPGVATMVATYAFFPKLLAMVAGALIAYLSGPDRLTGLARLTLGPGALFDPETASPVLMAVITRLDVFTIWETILLAIGLQVTGRVTKTNSYIAAAVVWIIGALPGVLQALRG